MTNPIGLYLHIPFCAKRCAYCDFYSTFNNRELLERYTFALIRDIKKWGGKINRPISSLYLGGGTPSLLNDLLPSVVSAVRESFLLLEGAEITLEINPSADNEKILDFAKSCGVNRLSIGAQSCDDNELKTLGRTHTADDTKKLVAAAREKGFDNISLDLMLSLPDSNNETFKKSLDFITNLFPEHISAYILKIEKNTLFYKMRNSLNLADDDEQANQYIFMCDYLSKKGYSHYEISNFCKEGKESRHNTLYWKCKEYLGIGAGAHSFLSGKRFYYPNDIKAFIGENETIFDGVGSTPEEFVMLNLRLANGIDFTEYKNTFGAEIPQSIIKKALPLQKQALLCVTDNNIYLTEKGMLLSNNIISTLLEEIE